MKTKAPQEVRQELVDEFFSYCRQVGGNNIFPEGSIEFERSYYKEKAIRLQMKLNELQVGLYKMGEKLTQIFKDAREEETRKKRTKKRK
jgi:hypothetical protein